MGVLRKAINFQHLLDRLTGQEKIGIYIFGTGYGGNLVLENLKLYTSYDLYELKGFLDNDSKKNGIMLKDLPVTTPSSDIIDANDYIFIASDKYADEMKNQLLSLGVNEANIVHSDQYLEELLPQNAFKYDLEMQMNGESSHSLILRQIKPKSVVLEIGTATGYMTKYLKETLQCSVTGIEVDQLSAAKAAVYADKMIVTDLNNFEWVGKLSNNKFDYIILADVLEHLQNPYEVLQRTVGFLKENGKIVASIPNIAHNAILMDLMQDKFKYHSFGLLDDSHIFFFTENTIRHLFHSSGLEICQWEKIIVSPKNTEFKQNYDRFPYAVKEYLQQRATGEIYQFIVCGRKVADLLKNKRVVFFGSGLSNQLLLQCFPVKVDYFVEDNPKRWNSIVNGLPVYNSSVLLKENTKDLIIIVASQFYTAFSKRLETMGFEERHHFYSSELFDSFLDMKLHFNRAIK